MGGAGISDDSTKEEEASFAILVSEFSENSKSLWIYGEKVDGTGQS